MTAEYRSEQIKNNLGYDVYVRYILTNHRQLTAYQIGNKNVSNVDNNSYGINGTYFYMSPPSGAVSDGYSKNNVYRIMIQNGANLPNQPKSHINRLGASNYGPCGTFMVFENNVSNKMLAVQKIQDFSNFYIDNIKVPQSNIRFAVGGVDLMMNQSFANEDAFVNSVTDSGGADYRTKRHRTAIVYIGGTSTGLNTVLLTVFDEIGLDSNLIREVPPYPDNTRRIGMSAWDLRNFIYGKWGSGVQMAVMLDSGGSTQIAYRDNNNVKKSFMTDDTAPGQTSRARDIQTMIRTPWEW